MTTYSLRCRNSACRHRRVSSVHPDDAKRRHRCPACGGFHGWRVENREYNRRDLCHCNAVAVSSGKTFPHRKHNPYCDANPWAPYNIAKLQGVPGGYLLGWRGPRILNRTVEKEVRRWPDWSSGIPQGRPMGADDPCPF